ncbi:MAG: hypothetical protein PVF58_00755 [Candidatus Methanofastidiosia archaeon]|jgi:hypothetical protein
MKSMALIVLLALQVAAPQFNRAAINTVDDAHLLDTADLDNDGIQEILFWNSKNEIICYHCTDIDSPYWTVQLPNPVVTGAAEDLDGDGSAEIYVLLEIGKTTVYQYRLVYIAPDGTIIWRKLIETKTKVTGDIKFHFINMDGKGGKEIVIATRVLVQEGLERMTFEWDRIVIETALVENTPYFLVYVPTDSVYELYAFEPEMHAFTEDTALWRGSLCAVNTPWEDVVCKLFYNSELCSCYENWTVSPPSHVVKSVKVQTDITGDTAAVYWTDTYIQLIESHTTVWTWESPDPIKQVYLMDITGDMHPEIVVITSARGSHVPSCYILDSTGTAYSYALNLHGDHPVVHFSDLDTDTDIDILTVDSTWRGTSIKIYTNIEASGELDHLDSSTSLELVDPSSVHTAFWRFYAKYKILILILVVILVGGAVIIKKDRIIRPQKQDSS